MYLGRLELVLVVAATLPCVCWPQVPDWQRGVAKVINANPKKDPGTAFVVSVSGGVAYLVTSAHVVAGDEKPEIRFAVDPEKQYPSTIHAMNAADEEHGLAILRVDAKLPEQVRPLPPGGLPAQGERVLLAGYPRPYGKLSVLDPVISRDEGLDIFLSQDAGEGYSGGPVLSGPAVVGIYFGRNGEGKAAKSSFLELYLKLNKVNWGGRATLKISGPEVVDEVAIQAVDAQGKPSYSLRCLPLLQVEAEGSGEIRLAYMDISWSSGGNERRYPPKIDGVPERVSAPSVIRGAVIDSGAGVYPKWSFTANRTYVYRTGQGEETASATYTYRCRSRWEPGLGRYRFGQTPKQVNDALPGPYGTVEWDKLPVAGEFPGQLRYFTAPLSSFQQSQFPELAPFAACWKGQSYVAFLFHKEALVRISVRLFDDCARREELLRELALYLGTPFDIRLRFPFRDAREAVSLAGYVSGSAATFEVFQTGSPEPVVR